MSRPQKPNIELPDIKKPQPKVIDIKEILSVLKIKTPSDLVFSDKVTDYIAAQTPGLDPKSSINSDLARIEIHCTEHTLLILFQKEPLPSNYYFEPLGVAFVDINQYSDYIDLVRNETPIWVTFNVGVEPPWFMVIAAPLH